MNWDQYFKLKDKQKKYFLVFLVVLVLLDLSHIKNFVVEGPDFVCNKINASCSERETPQEGNKYMDYLWFDCGSDCNNLSASEKTRVLNYRLNYTPLFILKDLTFAYVLSLALYSYNQFKINHKKEEKPEEESKEEDKKK